MRWRAWVAFCLMAAAVLVVVVLPGLGFVERLRRIVDEAPPAQVAPPPPPPITVALGDSWGVDCDVSKTCRAGHWRAYRTAVRTQVCASEVWNRYFTTASNSSPLDNGIRLLSAVASSTGDRALTPLTKGTGVAKPGTATEWWEYEKIADGGAMAGNYVVTMSWAACPDESSGQRTIYVIPFSWRPKPTDDR